MNSSADERVNANGFTSEITESIQNRIVDVEEGVTNEPAMIVVNNKRRKLRDPKGKKINIKLKKTSESNDSYLWFNKVAPITSMTS